MLTISVIMNVAFLTAAVVLAITLRRYQHRLYLNEGRKLRWPIPTVPLSRFDPIFAPAEFGPTLATEVHFVGNGDGVPGGTTEREAWILAVLAKGASTLFEFGTCTGRTTYLWARNAPEDAEVTTITLPPNGDGEYQHEGGDSARAARVARRESRFERFMYSGTPVATRVNQIFGDSKAFDETPFLGRCDLVFVDGSHAYSYVRSDTEKALRMLAPGGLVLWHDYKGPDSDARGVFSYLNELSRDLELVHLQGTTLVGYRAPGPRALR
jgi:hypothetical protein